MEKNEIIEYCFKSLLSYVQEPKNKYIYHYTSLEGLKSIMEKEVLWFSDIDYLNDESEVQYGYSLITDFLNKNKKNYSSDFVDSIKKKCNPNKLQNSKNEKYFATRCFILSFSNIDDSLPMWNYYSKNRNTFGYSIQFNKTLLLSKKNKDNNVFFISGNVVYNKLEQQKYIKKIINGIYDKYSSAMDNELIKYIVPLCINLSIFSLFTKNSCFMHEKEYRIVIPELVNNNNIDFRIYNNLLIPYISLEFSKQALTQIRLSPTQKSELIKSSLEDFTKKLKYNKTRILSSEIPLRY